MARFKVMTRAGLALVAAVSMWACGPTTNTDPGADAGTGLPPGSTPTCSDGLKNGTETDLDCGGASCPRCVPGKTCTSNSDCASDLCSGGFCTAPSCTDGVKNGTETGVDCGGGTCTTACADGAACQVATDCASGICTGNVCVAPTCTDGAKNGEEGAVDCGGTCPDKCADASTCNEASDCQSGVCMSGVCSAPTCMDGVKNGSESDIDCGATNCAQCAAGDDCTSPQQCLSGVCTGGLCQAPTCTDGVKNGDEGAVDCGGSCPDKCADGAGCNAPTDCQSKVCMMNLCQAPTCTDGVTNGPETDVDCGAACPQQCAFSMGCAVEADCVATITCVGGTCSDCAMGRGNCDNDFVSNGCEVDTTSEVTNCGACMQVCSENNVVAMCSMGSCQSGVCSAGFDDCNLDKLTDGCETDLMSTVTHCGGCGLACSTANMTMTSCVSAACAGTCSQGFGDCNNDLRTDGCEVNLAMDVNNCGACGAMIEDNNACTTDLCDPVLGVVHTPIPPADDMNACTQDACDPMTGMTTHAPVNPDDGNACTVDACNPATGISNTPITYFNETFATSAQGWTLGAGWQIGAATASSGQSTSFGTDPATDHTPTSDNWILGAYIGGNIPIAVTPWSYATSPAVNLTTVSGSVFLDFWRVLNSDYPNYMNSSVEVFNGTSWVTLYSIPSGGPVVTGTTWTRHTYDVTAHKNANFRVRFGYTVLTTSGTYTVGGWNVDDVRLIPAANCP